METIDVYCKQCGNVCKRNRRHTRAQHLNRKFCSSLCRSAWYKENYQGTYYSRNKERALERTKIRNQIIKKENYFRLMEYFKTHPCVDCGELDPLVLHFDHVRGKKDFGIGDNMCRKWLSLLNEIKKCEVRCANCHMRKTAQQFKWYSFIK